MSDSKFFNIGTAIFNSEGISSIYESTEKIEIEKPIVIVKYRDGNTQTAPMPEGKKLADFITGDRLNNP